MAKSLKKAVAGHAWPAWVGPMTVEGLHADLADLRSFFVPLQSSPGSTEWFLKSIRSKKSYIYIYIIYITYIYILHIYIYILFFWGKPPTQSNSRLCWEVMLLMLMDLDLLDAFMEVISLKVGHSNDLWLFMLWSWQRFLQRCWSMSSHNGQFWLALMIDGDISLVSFIQVVVLEWFSVSPGPKQILLSGPPTETGRVLKNHCEKSINARAGKFCNKKPTGGFIFGCKSKNWPKEGIMEG